MSRERDARKGGKMRRARKKVCIFCVDKAESIDYKDCLLYTSDAADDRLAV